jgi:hypothetical protein
MLEEREKHDCDLKFINKQLGESKKDLYYNKCGYCETPLNEAGYSITIDHYRPTGKLKDDNSHPGYYWLAYEWTNLVPACQKCNGIKSSYFPIKGKRVDRPPLKGRELDSDACKADSKKHCDEKPLLLHPEVDQPEKHLVFLEDGRIEGLTPRGNVTIKICKLDRETLNFARKKLAEDFYRDIKNVLHAFLFEGASRETFLYKLDEIFKKIQQAQKTGSEYSRLAWFLYHEFDKFFIKPLKEEVEFGEKSVRFVKKAFTYFRKHGTCRKSKTND